MLKVEGKVFGFHHYFVMTTSRPHQHLSSGQSYQLIPNSRPRENQKTASIRTRNLMSNLALLHCYGAVEQAARFAR